MPSKEVDTAAVFVAGPMVDDTDFKTREAPAYNAAGADVSLYEETQAGCTQTALTLTTAGSQDWVALSTDGYATCEITAAQLNTAGTAWIGGIFTGVLPFESPHYDIVDTTNADNLVQIIADLTDGGRLDLLIDAILTDTGTTLPATLGTAQADLDTITGADGVNLLSATQASIDAVEADTNELQGDWVNGGRLDLLIDAIKAVTDLLNAATTEPTGVPSATETPLEQVNRLHQALRNKVTATAAKLIFYDDAGTALWEKDITDDGATFTGTEGNAP